MANIYFKCSCEKRMASDESGAGKKANCPDCGRHIQIPGPEIRWYCPNCGEYMAASLKMAGEHVQCCTCGTAVQVPAGLASLLSRPTPPRKSKSPPVLTPAFLILLVGLGAFFYYTRIHRVPPKAALAPINEIAAVASNLEATPIVPTNPPAFDPLIFDQSVEKWTPVAERELSQGHAALATGATVQIRLPTGFMVNGEVRTIGKDNVTVVTAFETNAVAFADMDLNNRLRCDPALRALWVALKAATSARKDMNANNIAMPKYAGSDSPDDLSAAAPLGDPEVEYKLGQLYLKGESLKKDSGFAFLYFQTAARQEHWPSAYCLGRMFLAGLSIEPNKAEGERLIALAATNGCDAAKSFIEKREQEKEEQKKLALEKKEKQRAEAARREAEARAQEAADAAEAARRAEAQRPKPSGIGPINKSFGKGVRLH